MPLNDNRRIDQMDASPDDRIRSIDDAQRVLLQRATLLLPRDRTLVELYVKNHASHRQLARMLQIPAGTVTRRLRRLINRLHEPIVLALLEPRITLQNEHRQLGLEYFLQGQSIRQLADKHQINHLEVRRMLEYIRGWFRAVGRPSRRFAGSISDD